MPKFELDAAYSPTADQPAAIESLAEGIRRRRALADAARGDRHGQDDDDGGDDRGRAEAGAGDRPQQDARGPAVQRVPHLLPAQRGRVLRLLLRLLPARGLRPEQGPVHREGLGDQPGDRPPAPLGHGGAVRPARRGDRRERVVHLRPGIAGGLRREPPDARQGRDDRPRRAAPEARVDPVHAQRHGAGARDVPGPRRDARDLPGVRRDRVPDRDVRRRGRAPAALRPADRRGARGRPRARRDLARLALQRARGHDRGRGGRDRAGAERALRRARGRGQAARVPSPPPAHPVRHGDAARARVLLGDRELLADPRRPQARRAALLPARLLPRRLRLLHRRVPPDRAADRRHVRGRPLAQADARRLRLPAPERDRQPAADLPGVPVGHAADGVRVGDARRVRAQDTRRGSSSRSSVRPGSSTPRSRSARPATRSTT